MKRQNGERKCRRRATDRKNVNPLVSAGQTGRKDTAHFVCPADETGIPSHQHYGSVLNLQLTQQLVEMRPVNAQLFRSLSGRTGFTECLDDVHSPELGLGVEKRLPDSDGHADLESGD